MSPASLRGEKNAPGSQATPEPTGIQGKQDLNDASVQEPPEQASSTPPAADGVQSGSLADTGALQSFPRMEARAKNSPAAELSCPDDRSSELGGKASFSSDRPVRELPSPSRLRAAGHAQAAGPYLEGFSFPNPYAQERQSTGGSLEDSDVQQCSSQSCPAGSTSPAVCSPAQELGRRKLGEEDQEGTPSPDSISEESGATGGNWGADCPAAGERPELSSRGELPAAGTQESQSGDPAESTARPQPGDSARPREGTRGAQGGAGTGGHSRTVQMSLYVHCIKGLVLALLAEDRLRADQSSIENVVSSRPLQHLQGFGCGRSRGGGRAGRGSEVQSEQGGCSQPCPHLLCGTEGKAVRRGRIQHHQTAPRGVSEREEPAWEVGAVTGRSRSCCRLSAPAQRS